MRVLAGLQPLASDLRLLAPRLIHLLCRLFSFESVVEFALSPRPPPFVPVPAPPACVLALTGLQVGMRV